MSIFPKIFISLFIIPIYGQATICSEYDDDRVPTFDSRVGRVRAKNLFGKKGKNGATAFLIGKSCMLTAGHVSLNNYGIVEFNVPKTNVSKDNKKITKVDSESEHTYSIKLFSSKRALRKFNTKYSNAEFQDWSIFKVNPNTVTNQLPGDRYGYFDISTKIPKWGDRISIKGFGSVYTPGNYNSFEDDSTLQLSAGKALVQSRDSLGRILLSHTALTEPGSSGSPILINDKVIGIHSAGDCWYDGKETQSPKDMQFNTGFLFANNQELLKEIQECLDSED